MFKNKLVIFFGGKDWWIHTISTGARFCKLMADHDNYILFVNNLPVRAPKIGKKSSGRRYIDKIKSMLKFLRKAEKNIWVMTPIFFPFYETSFLKNLNIRFLQLQLYLSKRIMGCGQDIPLIFSQTPVVGLILPRLRHQLSIYYVADKYDRYREITAQKAISELDRSALDHSDIVITVSKELYKHYSTLKQECHYIPHGVDFDLFNRAASKKFRKPEELAEIKPPIIGYFGSISSSNDQHILRYIAQEEPGWSIVLIGEIYGDYSRLKQFPNVYFLGKKDLQELPAYGHFFDVCIMNWKLTEWIHYCSPVKTKEYLAMGKPVISVPIPEVIYNFSDVVSIAATPQEFHEKIKWELKHDSDEKRRKRIQKVMNETWASKMEQISYIIKGKLG